MGTVFHITLRVLGRRQRLHMRVAEPEPGRVLTETNVATGVVTRFTVEPVADPTRALTRMSSQWPTGGGLKGLADRSVTPMLMRRAFARQLRQLNRYLHSGQVAR